MKDFILLAKAMTDNDESDAYTNNLLGNLGYKINDEIKLQAS